MKELNSYILEKLKINKDSISPISNNIKYFFNVLGLKNIEKENNIDEICELINEFFKKNKNDNEFELYIKNEKTLDLFDIEDTCRKNYNLLESNSTMFYNNLDDLTTNVSSGKYIFMLCGKNLMISIPKSSDVSNKGLVMPYNTIIITV